MNPVPLKLIRSIGIDRRMLTPIGIAGVVGILSLWLYAPTRNFDFVNWDDGWYVLYNPLIQSWSFANLKSIATESVIRNYAPLTIFSFLVEYTLWGDWAGGYHLVNVFLHAANAILAFFLLRQLTGRTDLAAVAAVLFAVHPVHVESVAWISSRKGLISGAFILASLMCWLREDRSPKHEVWGIGFLILALLAKAIAVVVPPLVLCYDLVVRRQRCSDAVVRQIVPGLLAFWLLLATMAAQVTMLGGVRAHLELSRWEILGVDLIILWRYVGMLFCPTDLCVLYDPATSGIGMGVLISGLAWAGVCWVLWSKRNRYLLVFLAAASWILFLIPVLNLFPITTLMNDRYLYLPSIPALAVVAGCLVMMRDQLGRVTSQSFSWVIGGLCVLLMTAGLANRTRDYLPVWRNDFALWEHAVQHVPQLAVVQIQRATSLHDAGDTEAALESLEHALTHCQPDDFDRERIEAKLTDWR